MWSTLLEVARAASEVVCPPALIPCPISLRSPNTIIPYNLHCLNLQLPGIVSSWKRSGIEQNFSPGLEMLTRISVQRSTRVIRKMGLPYPFEQVLQPPKRITYSIKFALTLLPQSGERTASLHATWSRCVNNNSCYYCVNILGVCIVDRMSG